LLFKKYDVTVLKVGIKIKKLVEYRREQKLPRKKFSAYEQKDTLIHMKQLQTRLVIIIQVSVNDICEQRTKNQNLVIL
jgi:hypothetical protein